MTKEIIAESSYSRAYQAWFSAYDQERRRQKKRPGARLAHWPDPPTSPDDIAAAVAEYGRRQTLELFEIHRTTLDRWLSGAAVMPRASWLLLRVAAFGLLPGMSDSWRPFRFVGDHLEIIGTRTRLTAHEIAGLPYLHSHIAALNQRIADQEKQTAHLMQIGRFDCANDALISSA